MRAFKIISCTVFAALLLCARPASAQLTGLQSMYFENQYLANPAFAGMTQGLNLNLGYQAQWTSVPGSPRLQGLTADYNSGNRVGLGFIVTGEQSGLISRTRVMGTYAYHLPVSDGSSLNFGVSLGLNDSYIDYSKINGDQGDMSVALFNQRKIYVDGDFGISYTTNAGLNLQAAIPNLGNKFFDTGGANLGVDRTTFYTAASYRFTLSENYLLEPKAAFRAINGFKNIFDGGVNLVMSDYSLSASALYHSNQSATAGVGFDLKPVRVLFSYTYNTGPFNGYANNTFEFGLKYTMFNKLAK